MRIRAINITLVILLAWSVSCQPRADSTHSLSREHEQPTSTNPTAEARELTIRNVTRETVHYTINPAGLLSQTEKKSLEPGDIDRFPGDNEWDITFQQGSTQIDYSLDPGMPYSFRYNENGQLELYDGSHGRADVVDLAPFVPTPMNVVEKMLEMAQVSASDIVYDLGCGDGRIVITAAKKYGARGVGIDLDPLRVDESIINAKAAGVEDLVEFRLQDATQADLSEATIVTMYLLTESNELLRPQLERQLKPGTYIVSHNYTIPEWEDKEVDNFSLVAEDNEVHNIYVYRR